MKPKTDKEKELTTRLQAQVAIVMDMFCSLPAERKPQIELAQLAGSLAFWIKYIEFNEGYMREDKISECEEFLQMPVYTYIDHSIKEYLGNGMFGEVVYVCKASNILEADAWYTKATGNDPVKQAYVGVSWE